MKHPHVILLDRWFEEVWNQGKTTTIDELLDPNGIVYGLAPNGLMVRGPAGFKLFYERLRTAFSDIRVKVEDSLVQGDKVAGRWSAVMTHRGEGLGIAPTQRQVRTTGICFCRLVEGKIVESWENWDALGLLEQLGAGSPVKLV